MAGELAQFLGSLLAILALAGLALWLKLGPEGRLTSEAEAREAAREAVDGFEAVHVALDRKGRGAVLTDRNGRVLLLRTHGTHFAGRILTPEARAGLVDGMLDIDTAETRFGSVRFAVENAQAWVKRIEALR